MTVPPFIRPSVNPAPECDIWGPICQTGTIAVAVDLITTTTITTVPCSCYLEAQSISAIKFIEGGGYFPTFQRSPQCTSYVPEVKANLDIYLNNTDIQPTCADYNNSKLDLLPYGVVAGLPPAVYFCCGPCTPSIQQIQVFYFPEDDCSICPTYTSGLSSITLRQRAHSLLGNGSSTAVFSGYTLYVTGVMSPF